MNLQVLEHIHFIRFYSIVMMVETKRPETGRIGLLSYPKSLDSRQYMYIYIYIHIFFSVYFLYTHLI